MIRAKILIPLFVLAVLLNLGGLYYAFFIVGGDDITDLSPEQYNINEPFSVNPDPKPQTEPDAMNQTEKQPEVDLGNKYQVIPPPVRFKPVELEVNLDQSGQLERSVTVSDIERHYRPQFLALEQIYNARLNNLAAQGISEYKSYKENGQNPPVLKLVRKYINAGNALEAECDRRVIALLDSMKQDLIAENLPTELVNKVQNDYSSQKAQRKKQLIQSGFRYAGL